ncbi:hypothetical protein [Acidiferrobacter sp.]|jgi:hypothetical protein|uniref:hypothetical protein n=1 Tax=Acidiferrobacter sp. TaxID=1872107 RepID=UPI00260D747A|nr:hypothetical protein [Acidiferrobacter sp.]
MGEIEVAIGARREFGQNIPNPRHIFTGLTLVGFDLTHIATHHDKLYLKTSRAFIIHGRFSA